MTTTSFRPATTRERRHAQEGCEERNATYGSECKNSSRHFFDSYDETRLGVLFIVVSVRIWSSLKNRDALKNPEHGHGTDGIRGHEFCPLRRGQVCATREGYQRQHHADEQEMAGLDAQAEEQQCRGNVKDRQSGIT